MDRAESVKLAQSWIVVHTTTEDSSEYKEHFWAAAKMLELAVSDPEECWSIILEIHEMNRDDRVIGNLAAGPLEDLLCEHGDAFIDRVEARAFEDPSFKRLLGGVWKNNMKANVWVRVQRAAGEPW